MSEKPEDEDFHRQMARFAKTLQEKAAKDDTTLQDATNAFKALTGYYAILRKFPLEPDEPGDTTFDELQEQVHAVVAEESQQNGSAPPVRGRDGRTRRHGG